MGALVRVMVVLKRVNAGIERWGLNGCIEKDQSVHWSGSMGVCMEKGQVRHWVRQRGVAVGSEAVGQTGGCLTGL